MELKLKQKIKVGICGLGRAGRQMHIPELASYPDLFEIIAGCDTAPDRLLDLPPAAAGIRTFATLPELLADPEVELVTIATRNADHTPQAIEALEAGKYVVIEKPIAVSVEQVMRLKEASERYPGKLFLRFNRRYEPEFNHIRRILSRGILGRITMIKLYRHPVYCRRRDWQTLNRFCGGMLNNWGPHILDQALQLLGSPVVDVWSNLQHNFSAGDADDQIKILLKAANGCVADIEISSTCALPGNLYEVWGDRGALTVPNEGKVLRLKYLKEGFQLPEIHAETGNYPLFYGNQEPLELICEEIPVEAGRGHTLQKGARKASGVGTQATGYYSQDTMWLDVYDAIRNGIPYPITMEDGVNVVKLTELIHRQNSLPIGG